MAKRLSVSAKENAYNDAIDALRQLESDSDTQEDKDARFWLADKLDKECDRMILRSNDVRAEGKNK